MAPEKSPLVALLRPWWRALTRPAAWGLRLRHAYSLGERLRERVRVAWLNRRYGAGSVVAVRVERPAAVTTGPPALWLHLDPRDGLSVAACRRALGRAWPAAATTLLVLVRYRRPPLLAARTDADVRCWAATAATVARLPGGAAALLTVLDAALRLPEVSVQVVQVGAPPAPAPMATPAPPVAWVVPHAGSVRWLAECLARLVPQLRPGHDEACIGLDEAPGAASVRLRAAFPACWFGVLRRPGVGPFVVRQRAVERTTAPTVLFQDADDVPTLDRALRLATALEAAGLDAVGSHELRLDYLTGRVVAVRFPVDASAALRLAMGHPALFPTLLVRRRSLLAVGGFSTYLRFALDTQLLLRASFTWRLGNVDAFLYLRRRRPDSLTTAPATALGSPAREEHRARWRRDFAAVQAGRLTLAASSLAVRRGAEYDGNWLEELA